MSTRSRLEERGLVRPIVGFLTLCLGVALVGEAAPSPAPQANLPTVVVYPFGTSGELKPAAGLQAEQIFVNTMRSAGGMNVIAGGAGVKRIDYPRDAANYHADYYVSGYMTSLGDSVALVEQLVSVSSGIIVFAKTAEIGSFQDATAQALSMHDAVLAQQATYNAQIAQAATPSTTPSPKPIDRANLGNLFGHHSKPTPRPDLAPSAKPARGIYVVRIDGDLSGGEITEGTQALLRALNDRYAAHLSSAPHANLAAEANSICGAHRDNTIASGRLTVGSQRHGLFTRREYAFALHIYTCFGAVLATENGRAGSIDGAVAEAARRYARAHPRNF